MSEIEGDVSCDDSTLGNSGKKFSRRQFLRGLTEATVALPTAVNELEKYFYKVVTTGMKYPQALDIVAKSAEQATELAPNTENENYRSMGELIKAGIWAYESNAQTKVSYTRSADYRDPEFYSEEIDKIVASDLWPQLPSIAV